MPTVYPSRELLDTKRSEGVIEPARLPLGTIILLETNSQVYELVTREDTLLWATGCGKRSFSRQPVEFIGSIDQNGTLFAGLVVKDQHMVLKLATGRYVTGCIRSASIFGQPRGEEYRYELWKT